VFPDPATLAVNCWLCEADRFAFNGVRVMLTVGWGAVKLILAVADFEESAWLVAMMTTFCELVIVAGAV